MMPTAQARWLVLFVSVLFSTPALAARNYCGDDHARRWEVCDGTDLDGQTCQTLGFDGGTLACDPDCRGFDTSGCTTSGPSCGDGTVNGTEECDGADLGDLTCLDLGFDGGTLACDGSCAYDISGCTTTGPSGVVIAQVFYDTPGTDSVEEFIDLYNGTGAAVDLSGWSLADGAGSWTIPAGTVIGAGATLSVARDAAGFEALFGLVPDVEGMTIALNNTGDSVSLLDDVGAEADHMAYEGYEPGWDGVAATGDSLWRTDPGVDSDGPGDWSTLSPAWPLGGTAGGPTCGDGTAEAPEACDGADLGGETCLTLGFDAGTLACDGACGFDTSACETWTCGDGTAQGTEACDGADLGGETCLTLGFDAGTLACDGACGFDTSACTMDPVCGDGTAEAPEACDGTDLGGETCLTLGYDSGTLACDGSCGLDVSGCVSNNPFCGDDLVNGSFEECDGLDDGACPGDCSDHCACPATTGNGELEIHVVDVGQGDGLVVVSPDGFVMLVDAGTEGQAAAIESYMASIGLTSADYSLVSHMHADHMGGMDLLLQAFPEIVASFDSGSTATSGEYLEYEAAVGDRRTTVTDGELIDLGPSMTAEVLHSNVDSSNENNNSVVVKLTYGNLTYLIGGDCEESCENDLVTGKIDVYKVHHHGSTSSTSEALMAQMTPQTAVISVGAGNAYGHPAQSTLDRLTAYNTDVWRTDLDGDVEVLAGNDWYLVNGQGTCTDGAQRACGTTDVGACSYGVQDCFMGTWQPCQGAIEPIAEVCDNGTDDDCDGVADAQEIECGGVEGSLVIAQVYYDTAGTDSIEEFVDLYNGTASAIDLSGYTLSDGAGTWVIPGGTTIPSDGYLSVARDAAGFEAHFGLVPDVEGLTTALNNTGDVMVLGDDLGGEVDRVAWESYEPGWSITAGTGDTIYRIDPLVDTDSVSDWAVQAAAPFGGTLP